MLGLVRAPASYEEHWHRKVGAVFSRLFAQGYWEKFRGTEWREMPVPESAPPGAGASSASYSQQAVSGALGAGRKAPASRKNWRHPRLGTGQLFTRLHREIEDAGGHVQFETEVDRIEQQPDGSWALDLNRDGTTERVHARHVISSLSVERLSEVLFRGDAPLLKRSRSRDPVLYETRHVLLVYLFIDGAPRFPHAWLEVNDPDLRCGRITNYTAFAGDMVPEGKTCLCVEFFCSETADLLGQDDDFLTRAAIEECNRAGLLDPSEMEGSWVMRLARTNAASSWRELQSEDRRELLDQLKEIPTFFHVNRPGCDWASLAGLFAGRAVATGSRAEFDERADPTQRLPELPERAPTPPQSEGGDLLQSA